MDGNLSLPKGHIKKAFNNGESGDEEATDTAFFGIKVLSPCDENRRCVTSFYNPSFKVYTTAN
ncbi:hypothetical protein RND81_07G092000 [Saponaria officinalis]|uniref:Uncharacterized protein n=1 Tax=Saponaria officinalis TaxID=3572 RepID=A0AAW1JPA3_SAPOF